MNLLIDADGCPVVDLTLQIAKQFGIPVIILCDTSHQIEREGVQTLVFDKGADRRPVLIRTILAAKKAPAQAGAFCWRRWWDSNPRARLRTKRFRVFEIVG